MIIKEILRKYNKKLDLLDLELLVAHAIGKSREFVLVHPEFELNKSQVIKIERLVARRIKKEPIAHILGEKEFYGLNFKVTKDTLIPRPETELLIERVLNEIQKSPSSRAKLTTGQAKNKTIIDIGTGSGNIIIALAKNLKNKNIFYGIDISEKALRIAKQNAKLNKVDKKIKFSKRNLLSKFKKEDLEDLIIIANLPYLSKKVYEESMKDVKDFEPKSALYSPKEGLDHYEKLFKQIKNFEIKTKIFIEFSPEQKKSLNILAKKYFPQAKLKFQKDLAQKWRVLEVYI